MKRDRRCQASGRGGFFVRLRKAGRVHESVDMPNGKLFFRDDCEERDFRKNSATEGTRNCERI
jgi:hypothetical protein